MFKGGPVAFSQVAAAREARLNPSDILSVSSGH
jgi:hypothetical protein